MTIHGILLAGGQSRRMGGCDKACLDLAGRTLASHVMERLKPQCGGIVISANGDPSRFDTLDVPVVADDIVGYAGPLAGIAAALDWFADHVPQVEAAVSCAVDTPFVPRDLVERLRSAARQAGTSTACASSDGRRHPVVALWPLAARHRLRSMMTDHGERRVSAALEALGCTDVSWPSLPFDPFFNINTTVDLERAERWMARGAAFRS